MRVLLINTNTKDDVLAAPPIGLGYVASAVRPALDRQKDGAGGPGVRHRSGKA